MSERFDTPQGRFVNSKYYYSKDSLQLIKDRYKEVKTSGVFLYETDGQFTGGYCSEAYEYNNARYEFCFDTDELNMLIVENYKGE